VGLSYSTGDDDVLGDVLGTLRLSGRLFCTSEFSAPWAMTLGEGDHAHFHVVERGGAWLRVEGEPTAVALASGDLVIVPHGRGHTLGDSPTTEPVPFDSILRTQAGGHYAVRHGGGGAETRMICGAFGFDDMTNNPVLALLPPVLHVRSFGGRATEWLDPLLKLLASEARHAREGSTTVVARLTDIIFVQAVRAWLAAQEPGEGGWLGALRDPQIAHSLVRIHREPERAWSVASLAAEVGMSRSPFAARFKVLVGETPLAYLTRWRMQVVASMLRAGKATLGEMAARAGYESEAAFSKAFKRHFGVSPSEYRRRAAA
jgi:AraC-like DNA-binding protein